MKYFTVSLTTAFTKCSIGHLLQLNLKWRDFWGHLAAAAAGLGQRKTAL